MKALFFVRDFNVNNFIKLSEYYESLTSKYFVSESDLNIKNYKKINYSDSINKLNYNLSYLNIDEIILRDRMLRGIDKQIAKNIVINVSNSIFNIFEELKPNIIFGQLVDYYIYDIAFKIAKELDVKVVSFLDGFIDNTCALSTYGELELKGNLNIDFFEYFGNKNQPNEVTKLDKSNSLKLFINGIRSDAKRKIIKIKNYKSYHAYKHDIRTVVDGYQPQLNKWSAFSFFYFEELNSLDFIDKKKSVYVPMHFYPEAVIDYWIKNLDLISYELLLEQTIKINQDIVFILKEHPFMVERRSFTFYKKLSKYRNVIILNPKIRSFDIFNKIEYVFTWTGTAGLEAIFSNKKVITVEKTFYDIDEIVNVLQKEDLNDFIKLMKNCIKPSQSSLDYLNNKLNNSYISFPHIELANSDEIKKLSEFLNNTIKE
jgi:hypothetical protein